MESCILWAHAKLTEALRASLTLQETRSIQDSMNAFRASLTSQETRSIHDSMNISRIAFIS